MERTYSIATSKSESIQMGDWDFQAILTNPHIGRNFAAQFLRQIPGRYPFADGVRQRDSKDKMWLFVSSDAGLR